MICTRRSEFMRLKYLFKPFGTANSSFGRYRIESMGAHLEGWSWVSSPGGWFSLTFPSMRRNCFFLFFLPLSSIRKALSYVISSPLLWLPPLDCVYRWASSISLSKILESSLEVDTSCFSSKKRCRSYISVSTENESLAHFFGRCCFENLKRG
jgi:hypothetical protein